MRLKEFSRSVRVEPLPRDGLELEIEADPQERAALAALNNLVEITSLKATFRITKWRKGVHVTGEVFAKVTQNCVVSLEPFEAEITSPLDMRYLPEDSKRPADDSLEDLEPPDPLIDGHIDLGAVAGEFLTLALDPYPRKPGAVFTPQPGESHEERPFAQLLKKDD